MKLTTPWTPERLFYRMLLCCEKIANKAWDNLACEHRHISSCGFLLHIIFQVQRSNDRKYACVLRLEITKPQAVMVISLRFWGVLNLWLVTTQSTFLKFYRCSWFSESDSMFHSISGQFPMFLILIKYFITHYR